MAVSRKHKNKVDMKINVYLNAKNKRNDKGVIRKIGLKLKLDGCKSVNLFYF